jgi:hypothetical protein
MLGLKTIFKLIIGVTLILQILLPHSNARLQGLDRGLIVSPPVQEISMNPSEEKIAIIQLENDVDGIENLDVSAEIKFFEMQGSGYIISDESPFNDNPPRVSIEQKNLKLTKGKIDDFKIIVNTDEKTKPGGYHYGIIYSFQPSSEEGGIKIINTIAATLFINIKGDTEKNNDFTKFEVDKQIIDPWFDKFNLNYTIKINGDYYFRPSGDIILGDKENPLARFDVNPGNGLIVGNSSKDYVVKFGSDPSSQNNNSESKVITQNISVPWYSFGSQNIRGELLNTNIDGQVFFKSKDTQVFFIPYRFIIFITIIILFGLGVFLYLTKFKVLKKRN